MPISGSAKSSSTLQATGTPNSSARLLALSMSMSEQAATSTPGYAGRFLRYWGLMVPQPISPTFTGSAPVVAICRLLEALRYLLAQSMPRLVISRASGTSKSSIL